MAEAVVQSARLNVILNVIETLQDLPGAAGATVKNKDFNQALALNPSTAVPVSRCSFKEYTFSGTTQDIDLTALAATQTAVDATGKKIQALLFINNGANSINVAPGATNAQSPYGSGNDIDIPPGGFNLHYAPETLADVGGSAKNIRVTGTSGQTFLAALLVG